MCHGARISAVSSLKLNPLRNAQPSPGAVESRVQSVQRPSGTCQNKASGAVNRLRADCSDVNLYCRMRCFRLTWACVSRSTAAPPHVQCRDTPGSSLVGTSHSPRPSRGSDSRTCPGCGTYADARWGASIGTRRLGRQEPSCPVAVPTLLPTLARHRAFMCAIESQITPCRRSLASPRSLWYLSVRWSDGA